MRRGLVVTAALASCAVAGCGGGGHADRKQVAAYIRQVAAIEARMSAPLKQITLANRSFAGKHPDLPAVHRKLAVARAALRVQEARLRRLTPPAKARRLQTLVVRLAAQEDELAGEVDGLTTFVPVFAQVLQPLAPASAELKRTLAAKDPAAQKAAALRAYGAVAGRVESELETLSPPPATRPTLEEQAATLRSVRSAVLALATALERNQASRVAPLLRRFDAAAVSNRSVAAQKAEIAAIEAYDRRIAKLAQLATSINSEEARLQLKA